MIMLSILLGLLLTRFCASYMSGSFIEITKVVNQFGGDDPFHFISITLPRFKSTKGLYFFQLCFLPKFPYEIPDEMWEPSIRNSGCYIRQATEEVPKYIAIGVPIRLGPREYPEETMEFSLMNGNGIIEIEYFENKGTRENVKLFFVVRNTILLAGTIVAHLFTVKIHKLPVGARFKSDWIDLVNNNITSLNTSEIDIKSQEQYCYLMPDAPESDINYPHYEDTHYIKYLCDVCWFDKTEPNFVIKLGQRSQQLASEMIPHPAFRRYFGILRIASLEPDLLKLAYSSAYLSISPGEGFKDLPFRVLKAASPPEIEVVIAFNNQRRDAILEGYVLQEEKVINIDERVYVFYITPKIKGVKKATIEFSCKSTGLPEPNVFWKMKHSIKNLTIVKDSEEIMILDDPYSRLRADGISCTASNKVKDFHIKEIISVEIFRHVYVKKKSEEEASYRATANLKSTVFNIFLFSLVIGWFFVRSTVFEMMDAQESDSLGTDRSLSTEEESDAEDAYF